MLELGLLRCGKSCRLRWMNYLRPNIKRGNITCDEDDLIIRLHSLLGNRWSLIAGRLPGRTDNEIKNYWNTHLSKRLVSQGTDDPKKISELLITRKTNLKRPKRNNNMKEVDHEIQEKSKVHQPKPIRVSSFSRPRNECNTFSSGTSSTQENNNHVPWSNFKEDDHFIDQHNEVGIFLGDHKDHDLVNGSDSFECQSEILPTNSNSLEKLFDEYFQLLKTEENQVELDTFAESLMM